MSTHRNHPSSKKYFKRNLLRKRIMAAFMAKKKAEDMRDELRQLISFTRGIPSAWQEASSTWKHKFVKTDRRQFTTKKKDEEKR